jgi:tetratricopeptide (TPR) repeat protein
MIDSPRRDREVDGVDLATTHYQRATLLVGQGHAYAALQAYERALALRPDFVEALVDRGFVLAGMENWEAAAASFEHAIAIRPASHEAHFNRGLALAKLRRWDEALASYDRAIALKPAFAMAYSNRGIVQRQLVQWEAALASYDQAVALEADFADAHYNRANLLQAIGQLDAALASYDRAIALDHEYADAYYNRGFIRLLSGQFAQGFADYEWRWRSKAHHLYLQERHFAEPLWLGREPIAGKTVLLHAEQGLGDTLQFCRYAPLVAARGARVILEVPQSLVRLLDGLAGRAQVIAQGSPLPRFDCHCPLLSLPLAFNTDIDSIPDTSPYLAADPARVAHWQARLGHRTRPRVGLVWSGNARHSNDAHRSIALADLLPHLPLGIDYVSLQKDVREEDRTALEASALISAFADEFTDFAETAALCANLDLMICVDTSVAHLSTAMGLRTWILIPALNTDWRWLLGREDSPWYPSAKLYRQSVPGDWRGALARLAADLREALPVAVQTEGTAMQPSSPPAKRSPSQRFDDLLRQAATLHTRGEFAKSATLCETILERQPTHIEALHLLALLCGQAGDIQRAIGLFRKVLTIDSRHVLATFNLGIAFYNLRRFDTALAGFDRAISLKPDFAEAHHFRAQTLRELAARPHP